jgi:hypothetical protein
MRRATRRGVAAALTAGLAAAAPLALAAKPPKGVWTVTLDAKPNPVVFTKVSTLSGRLSGPMVSGVAVKLEQDTTVPLGDKFSPTGMSATTAVNGRFAFALKPGVNTQYRVIAQTSPSTTSPARLISVRPLVGLKVSDSTPTAGARVRFSGTVLPAHNGLAALIRRRSPTGRWVTVTRTTLAAAGSGSSYATRLRVRRSGTYRVKVAGHADHVNGFSRTLTLTVG